MWNTKYKCIVNIQHKLMSQKHLKLFIKKLGNFFESIAYINTVLLI